MPLPRTTVIHPNFQPHHAPVANGGMTATVDLLDPSLPAEDVYDRETGQTTSAPAPPAASGVPARVQRTSGGDGLVEAVAQDVSTPPYLVAVPYYRTAGEGWVVHVRDCPDDLDLVDRRLVVRQVVYGSTRVQRDLFCEDE